MHPLRWIAAAGATARREAAQAARITVCATCAWQIALWLGASNPPVFAALVPLVALQGDPFAVIGLSLERGRRRRRHCDRHRGDPPHQPVDRDPRGHTCGGVHRRHGAPRPRAPERAGRDIGAAGAVGARPGTYGHERLWETASARPWRSCSARSCGPNPLRELEKETKLAGRDLLEDHAAHGAAGRHSCARRGRQRDARPRPCPVGPAGRRRRAEGRTGGAVQPAPPLTARRDHGGRPARRPDRAGRLPGRAAGAGCRVLRPARRPGRAVDGRGGPGAGACRSGPQRPLRSRSGRRPDRRDR